MKIARFYISLSVCIFIMGISCTKPITISTADTATTMLNTAYGTDPQQVMDIFLPDGRNVDSTKVVILIHGGAWIGGDKTNFTMDGAKQLFPNYAIFNINYRLANPGIFVYPFPTQELDVKAAVQFIYNNRLNYRISNSWCFFGTSAGAHLAMLQAYKYTTPIQPKVVIDLYGPTDMIDLYYFHSSDVYLQSLIGFLMNGSPTSNPALYNSSSPIGYVNATSPKTLILQGKIDTVVNYKESERLHDTLTTLGVTNKYVLYPLQGHGFTGADAIDSYYQVDSFVRANMQ